MTGNVYQRLAQRTSVKDQTNIEHLITGALGLAGESGEVADIIKKAFSQGHKLDRASVAEELGDVLWYVAETASAIGYGVDEIMEMNIKKLRRRYPNGFDSKRSINRKESDY